MIYPSATFFPRNSASKCHLSSHYAYYTRCPAYLVDNEFCACFIIYISQPTLQNAQRTCPILQQQPYKSMEVPQQYLLATFTLFFHSSLDIYSCHQDHHHPVGVVLNPHPLPILYTPEITTGLTAKHQVLCLSGTYSAENWVFGKYVQVFQLAVSLSLVLFSMMIIVS